MRTFRSTLLFAFVLAACAMSATAASAAPLFDYSVSVDDGVYTGNLGGEVSFHRLDTTKTTRVLILKPSGETRYDSGTIAAGSDYFNTLRIADLALGDKITVRQPALSIVPTEVFDIPILELNVVAGATTISGSFPAGLVGALIGDYRCNQQPNPTSLRPGPFSVPAAKILPGESVRISAATAAGDSIYYLRHAPGESPCVTIDARVPAPPVTGGSPQATPYEVDVDTLNEEIASSVRVVVRRGGAILADVSSDNEYVEADFATQPLPGDIIDIYRPKTAPTPLHTRSVPQVSAVFDASVELVAISGPAAAKVQAGPCRVNTCPLENIRTLLNVPAGKSFLNFAVSEGIYRSLDLRPDDRVAAVYNDPDNTVSYTFQAVPGDLVAPKQSIKLASKLKRKTLTKAFKKGFKVKVTSNEAGPGSFALAFPKAKAGKAVTLAKASKPVGAGTTSVTLKFTKAGKKALKKLRKRSSRLATLTSTVTDASGNASTLVKRTKIKA